MALFSYFLFGYFWSLNRSIGRLSLSCRPADRAQVRCLHITAPSQVRSLSQSSRLLPAHQTVRHIRQDSVDEILNNRFFLFFFSLLFSPTQLGASARPIPLASWIYRPDVPVAVLVAKTRTPPRTALLPAHLHRLTGDPSVL